MRFCGRRCLAWLLIITVCVGVICARAGEPIAPDADVQLRIAGDVERPMNLKGVDLAPPRLACHSARTSAARGC